MGKKYWPGSNSNLASGTKEACNRDVLDEGIDFKGASTLFALSRLARESVGSL